MLLDSPLYPIIFSLSLSLSLGQRIHPSYFLPSSLIRTTVYYKLIQLPCKRSTIRCQVKEADFITNLQKKFIMSNNNKNPPILIEKKKRTDNYPINQETTNQMTGLSKHLSLIKLLKGNQSHLTNEETQTGWLTKLKHQLQLSAVLKKHPSLGKTSID